MVDLSGGADGPLELAFSNSVFILPGIVVVGLSEKMADETPAPSGMNLGGVISEKLTETIKNMDVMNVLQKMVASSPSDDESEDVRQKLQGVLAQFNAMNEEDKEAFTAKIKEGLAKKISAKLQDPNAMDMSALEDAISSAVMNQLYLIAGVILFIIIIVVFFGYKLYKSIKEKELKKEEKKKAKQLKKKK